MKLFLIMFIIALVFSAVGFKKYIWFISIGYGYAIAGIGAGLLFIEQNQLSPWLTCACILFILYGLRLGGFLTYREFKVTTYNAKMKSEIKSGDQISFLSKCMIWIFAALLYASQTAPVTFRLANDKGPDPFLIAGIIISAIGLVLETGADYQKNAAKKENPGRFVDTRLFKLVRCPNYFGEMLFWTGCTLCGIPIYQGPAQWIIVLAGYIGIIYVMFSGARRLEIRQNKTYGDDPEYRKYIRETPILIPFVPIYSVEKHKWLVA